MTRAVLFDLDGVLVETRDLHFRALNAALVAHGCLPITPVEHADEFDGLPTATKLDRLVKYGRVRQDDIPSIKALKQKETRRLLESEVRFDPGVYCLVCGLKEAGFKVGVVTNAVQETAELILSRLFWSTDTDVDELVTNLIGPPKPAPDLYLICCDRLGLKSAECLAVEDGQYGVQAATAAGCRVMKVNGPADVTPAAVWSHLE